METQHSKLCVSLCLVFRFCFNCKCCHIKAQSLVCNGPKKGRIEVCVCVCVLVMSLEELLKTSVGVRPLLQFYLSVQKCN